jgi:hypothetical protein
MATHERLNICRMADAPLRCALLPWWTWSASIHAMITKVGLAVAPGWCCAIASYPFPTPARISVHPQSRVDGCSRAPRGKMGQLAHSVPPPNLLPWCSRSAWIHVLLKRFGLEVAAGPAHHLGFLRFQAAGPSVSLCILRAARLASKRLEVRYDPD